jgi:superfamily II DNA or RNA helicase
LAKRTFKEAVAEGAVCPIVVWGVKVQFDAFNCWSRDKAYDLLLYHNSGFNALVKEISDNIIPGAFQTLIFCDEKKQIDLMNLFVTSGVPAIAQRLKPDERRAVFADMVSGKTKRCIATDIFSTGVTFPDLRVICNAASGASGISSTQKPGRLAQVRPGKVCGYLVDFVWEANGYRPEDLEDRSFDRASNAWSWLVRDSEARFKTYEALGYDVKFVENYEEIKIV